MISIDTKPIGGITAKELDVNMFPRVIRNGLIALSLASAGLGFAAPQPAAALSTIAPPANYYCDAALIRISPPRAWASANQPEPVAWVNVVQRWNGSAWVEYGPRYFNFGSFNVFGQNVTSWSVMATTRGGMYVNSRLNIPVQHQGYYRVYAFVGNSTLAHNGWIGGDYNYCWMP